MMCTVSQYFEIQCCCYVELLTNNVNVEAQVYRAVAYAIANALDNFRDTKIVNIIGRNELKPSFLIML